MARTKIVCTIGPASDSVDLLRAMIRAGMSVARINFSHGDHTAHMARIAAIRQAALVENAVVAILGDLQGPKLRVGAIRGDYVMTRIGDEIVLTTRDVPGDRGEVHLPHAELIREARPGQRLLLDDGQLEFVVLETTSTDLRCRVVTGGPLRSYKGVTAPGADLSLSALTDKDRDDTRLAVEQGLDFLALSFVRSDHDVRQLRDWLANLDARIPIVVKIEKPEAIAAFDDILACSDAVMIARGDLGVEMPAERVPFVQKDLIARCNRAGVPVITATQMLSSMVDSPRPTRAEASDVANAILDGTSAVMLSAETATGEYPLETVRTMARIAEVAEAHLPYEETIRRARLERDQSPAAAISQATVEIAYELGAKAIVTSTYTGSTARWAASYRPRTLVLAITPRPEVQRQLALAWGVMPVLVPYYETTDDMLAYAAQLAEESGLAGRGDTIVVTAGIPAGKRYQTNMLKVHVI
ncbi:MAG TPA: pyruvate kinase [Anaerolineae bacterium]|nr:pyruvate kinase [Anaerolineae bacterium]